MKDMMLSINGKKVNVTVDESWTLLYVLREVLGLTGTKEGCGTADCGACKVILDGKAVNSCVINIKKAEGKSITTIEGLADGEELHPIQQAYVDAGAVQCGFCTPGMIMTTKALLDTNSDPTEKEIRESFKNNLCRCTGYVKIVDAVKIAADALKEDK